MPFPNLDLIHAAGSSCSQNTTVRPNDTCASLAAAASLPLLLLHHLNPDADCTVPLQPGQQLCLFHREGCTKGYAVQANDSCASIATYHALSSAQLVQLNEGLGCGSLVAGQLLCITTNATAVPEAEAGKTRPCSHTVPVRSFDGLCDMFQPQGVMTRATET